MLPAPKPIGFSISTPRLVPTRTINTRKIAIDATKSSSNGSGSRHRSFPPSPSTSTTTKQHRQQQQQLEDLVRNKYFAEMLSGADFTLAPQVLHENIQHKDMVRDEMYCGREEVLEYMQTVHKTYPSFEARAVDVVFVPGEELSLFCGFEGRSAPGYPLFKGVDRFFFSEDGKVKEVHVYRSNWGGAKGHQQRKEAAEGSKETKHGRF